MRFVTVLVMMVMLTMMIVIVMVCCRYALGECGAVQSSLQCDPRFDHIQHMLQSAPLGSDSSDDD